MQRSIRTVTISLPPALAREVDKIARAEGRTRSELFREAVRQYIERRKRWEQLVATAREAVKGKRLSEEDVVRAVRDYRRERRQKRTG